MENPPDSSDFDTCTLEVTPPANDAALAAAEAAIESNREPQALVTNLVVTVAIARRALRENRELREKIAVMAPDIAIVLRFAGMMIGDGDDLWDAVERIEAAIADDEKESR